MGSLGSRMTTMTMERFKLLRSASPLWTERIFGASDLALSFEASVRDMADFAESAGPVSPQLQCDFYIELVSMSDGHSVVTSSENWLMQDFSPSASSITWETSVPNVIAFPTPTVTSGKSSITFLIPSIWTGEKQRWIGVEDYLTRILKHYEVQFSESGLLLPPGSNKLTSFMTVGICVIRETRMRSIEEYKVPLYRINGLRFDTPKLRMDPKLAQPMDLTLDFSYTSSDWIDFGEVGKRIKVCPLPEVVYDSSQFANR